MKENNLKKFYQLKSNRILRLFLNKNINYFLYKKHSRGYGDFELDKSIFTHVLIDTINNYQR